MANFHFIVDGRVDMMSLNPLEMTNFEMVGAIFGIAGIVITFIVGRICKRQKPHEFTAHETDEGAIE